MKKTKITLTWSLDQRKIDGIFWTRTESTDYLTIKELWTDNCYFKNFNISANWRILDIGGHIGAFAILTGKLGASHVDSYEPFLESYQLAIQNINENKLDNIVRLHNKAVLAKDGKFKIKISKPRKLPKNIHKLPDNKKFFYMYHPGENTVCLNTIPFTRNSKDFYETEIEAVSINDILAHNTYDMIKLDCEGSEYDILPSITPELLKKIPRLILEHHPPIEKGLELTNLLENNGFKLINCDCRDKGWALGKIFAINESYLS